MATQQKNGQPAQHALISNEDVKKLQEMGFKTSIIYKAADIASAENKNMLDVVIQLQDSEPSSSAVPQNKVASLKQDLKGENSSGGNVPPKSKQDYEVLTIDVRLRQAGIPVGLLNYGNTCYFNSLIQTYFFIPKFMETIMNYRSPLNLNLTAFSPEKQKRIQASINLVVSLQKLFGYMILSSKKYADPKLVLESIVDDQGNRVILGDQKDIGEFNLQFLERLSEGLSYQEGKNYDIGAGSAQKLANGNMCVDLLKSESNGKQRSALKKKISFMPTEDEDSIISQLFFGKKKEFITYYQAGLFKQYSEENIFSPIILDLQYQDLYTSWENNNTFYIDDFKDNNGNKTEAEKAGWITKIPEVLVFQIQRVVYLKDQGIAEKLNTPFHFEKEIFVDRFLLDNRDYILRNKPKLKALKKKRELIKQELQDLKNYSDSNFGILDILDMNLSFLKKQQSLFVEPNLEEEKFSPKTQSLLTGDNYMEVTDFTLDQQSQQQAKQQGQANSNNSNSNSSSSTIDLLSLFSSPTPAPPLTPQSASQLSSTIFDMKTDFSSSNEIPLSNDNNYNKDTTTSNGYHKKPENISQFFGNDLLSTNSNQVHDVGLVEINSKISNLNSTKQAILNPAFLSAVQTLKLQTSQLITSLELELLKTNKEIDDIYGNLKSNKYKLHAILIHQGFADSGHYFSYIWSADLKKWFKYNDIQVLEEQEQIVMQQAVGDGKSSAYCLVYLRDQKGNDRHYEHTFELMQEGDVPLTQTAQRIVAETANSKVVVKKQVVIDLLNLESDKKPNEDIEKEEQKAEEIKLQPVKNLVQDYLKSEILQQNKQQLVELNQFKQLQLADSIVENYSKRFSFINEYIRKTYDKSKKLTSCPPLTNFGVYLRWMNENVTDLLKVQLLDCSIREVSSQKMMLSDVATNQILNNRLLNNFESMGEFKSPGKLVLSPKEYEFIHKEYNKYLSKVSCGFAIIEAFNLILAKNIIGSFDYFHYIQQYNTNQSDYFFRMGRDMFRVCLLKASSLLFEMNQEPIEVVLKQIKYIILYCAKLPEGDTTIAQIYKIITEYMKYIGNTKLAQQKDRIISVVSLLQSNEKMQEQFKSYLSSQEKRFEELENSMMERAMQNDKYFWKVEEVTLAQETQINQIFSQISLALRDYINFHQSIVKSKKILDINERIQLNYQVNIGQSKQP